jgi:predicted GTPase
MTLANPAITVRASRARVGAAWSRNQVAMTTKAGSYRTAAMAKPMPVQMA